MKNDFRTTISSESPKALGHVGQIFTNFLDDFAYSRAFLYAPSELVTCGKLPLIIINPNKKALPRFIPVYPNC